VNNKNKKSASSNAVAFMLGFMLSAIFAPEPASAMNAFTIDTGYGLDDTKLLRLNFAAIDDRRLSANNGWHWSRSWEANLSYWYLYKYNEGERDLFELGITPNFRAERDWESKWGRPYLEAGLGVHLLSKVHIGPRDLGSALQFGTHAGFGLRFGSHEQWDVAWRYEHLSNAGLKEPNPGINFGMVRFGYRW
jgi:hypothetical protein